MRLALPSLCFIVLLGCGSEDDRIRLYHTESIAPGLAEQGVANLDHMGATIIASGVNFAVYSERATRIDLLLFDDPDANQPTRQFPMARFGDVWNLYVEGVGKGQFYGYVAWGPNWVEHPDFVPGTIHGFEADVDSAGNRMNPNKLLMDPYARAVHRDHDWSAGSVASGPARTDSTWGAAAKSIVWASDYEWSPEEDDWQQARAAGEVHGWNDLIIYEVHAKGFTASPASGVDHPGTYKGFAEKASYLAELGVTAVELMPVHEKPLDGTYWGYMTLNFFAPERTYAATARPLEVIDEFKEMVDELHKHGIEVFVDVVYNHTGEGGLWREHIELDDSNFDPGTRAQLVDFDPKEVAGLYSFRGLDNNAYYALSIDNQGYWNNTGVGNQTRPNHTPMRRLILDSLRFYAEELHADGFRFDLAPILGEKDNNFNKWDDPANTVLQEIIDDPVLRSHNVRIIAEPWSAGGDYGIKIGAFPAATGPGAEGVGWYEWNGNFRDWWRQFENNDGWTFASKEGPTDGGFAMTGSFDYYNWNGRRPYHSVNFVTAHDGFTMYDLFTHEQKNNACGPLNPVCCDQPTSPFCDRDSGESNNRSRDWGDEAVKRQLMRNLFVALLVSHGTPMLLGGDEWIRTQLGNNNAYSTGADNPYNWFDWGGWKPNLQRVRMHDFVRNVIAIRKEFSYALAPSDYGTGAPFLWKNSAGQDKVDWNNKQLLQHYYDPTFGPELAIIFNGEDTDVDFTLPTGRTWLRVLDTQSYFDSDAYVVNAPSASGNVDPSRIPVGDVYAVKAKTTVILVAE